MEGAGRRQRAGGGSGLTAGAGPGVPDGLASEQQKQNPRRWEPPGAKKNIPPGYFSMLNETTTKVLDIVMGVLARLYPNELLTEFEQHLRRYLTDGRAGQVEAKAFVADAARYLSASQLNEVGEKLRDLAAGASGFSGCRELHDMLRILSTEFRQAAKRAWDAQGGFRLL